MFNKIFLPVAFTILIIGIGIYFYNQKNNDNAAKSDNKSGTIPIANSSTGNSTNSVSPSDSVISNSNEYMVQVLDIRGPINKNIEDILSKTKYTTLFDTNTMIEEATNTKNLINEGIKKLEGLNLSSELKQVNTKQLESLKLLGEAMDAYIALQNTTDQTEKQKQSELFSYKVDLSNKAIESVSGSTSSGSSNSSSQNSSGSNNAVNIVQ